MATTVESLRKAIGKRKNSRAFAWLADLMRQNGDLNPALEYVRAGLSSTPCEEGNLVLSRILADKRDWDGVIEACESVLLRNPYCLSALRRIGDAYAEKGDVEKRNLYYRRLHDLDPLDAFWKEEYAPKIEIPETVAAETPVEEPAETGEAAGAALAQPPEKTELPAGESRNPAEDKDDDPFSSLSTLLPADEENDNEVSFNDLEHSLDDAIAGFGEASPEKDAFPTEEIDSDDISTALSGIFGSTEADDAPSPTIKPQAEKDAPRSDAEDKPQSLSDAFDSIFGEDELPEEFVLSKPAVSADDKPEVSVPAEPSPAASSPEKTEESLPPAEVPATVFDKSAPSAKPAPESALEKSVESSFESLFGSDSDDLPLETLTAPKTSADDKPEISAPSVKPSPAASSPEKTEETLPPAEVPSTVFDKSASSAKPASESALEKSMESSFESLFGSDSDDLPLETLAAPKTTADEKPEISAPSVKPSPAASSPEKTEEALPPAEVPATVFDKSAPSAKPAPESALEKSVESSFESLFGSDSDDLPLETLTAPKTTADEKPEVSVPAEPSPAASSPEKTEDALPPAEVPATVFDKSAPSAKSAPESALEKSVESSFESLFGSDSDDALVEDPTTSTRTLAEIYFEQGVYDEAVKIYKDLLRKSPGDESLKKRLSEIENICENGQKEN